VGLAVDHDAVPKMITKYQALLDKIASSDMPPDAQYRINVEKIARHRIAAAVANIDDPEKVEEICNCGQVEELVIQAENEMIVLDMYLRNRWWELVKPIEVDYDPGEEDGGHGDIEWGDAPADGKK
jgi:NADH dehydrogenase (ubiquinone) 1 alpha subcomplex subunit 5